MNVTDEMLYDAAPEAAKRVLSALPAREDCVHVFSKEFEAEMRPLLRGRHIRWRALLIAAAIIGALAAGFSVGASQRANYDLFYTVQEDGIRYAVRSDWDAEQEAKTARLNDVPEGYTLVETSTETSKTRHWIDLYYSNAEGSGFQVRQIFGNQTTGSFVPGTVEEVSIGGLDCLLMESTDQTKRQLVWTVESSILTLSGNLEREELIWIAEQIEIDHTNGS